MNIVIGIGEYAVSKAKEDKLKTFALASCIAVIAYSPIRKVGGMVHIALPSPTGKDIMHRPAYFASTGVPLMINKLYDDFGCHKEELQIYIYGGADSINKNDIFRIGRRNIQAVTDAISELNLKIHKSDVGGYQSRTIEIDIAKGNVIVSVQPITI
jgi:chemotaxis protein CheD